MDGKGKYKKPTTLSKVKHFLKENTENENIIIYCFDTDEIDKEPIDVKTFEEEKEFCKNNSYKLIWFDYNIEYVLLGHSVEDSKKKQESIKFYNQKSLSLKINKLRGNNEELKGYSNVYLILDDILEKL